jgi:tetratricopeptide (TPR) repeat protein
MKTTVTEELTERLQKYKLTEPYETFMRIVSERWKNRLSIFPDEFLENLQKDTSQFPLPYYNALKAISDFYSGNYEATKKEITLTLRYSHDSDLNERLDQLRIIIMMNERHVPSDVLQHMKLGQQMEEEGNLEKAKEHYQDAILIAEDFSPAAFALGKWYERANDGFKANNYFQKAIAKDSLYYAAYRYLYMNYIKNSNFKIICNN